MGVTEYETRQARITDAFVVAIKIGNRIKSGSSFHTTLAELDGPFERLTDRYPQWHPAPYPFHGILKLFLYREVTGWSDWKLTRNPELASVFGLERIPNQSTLSRAWRHRLNDAAREFITKASRQLVSDIHRYDMSVAEVRPPEELEEGQSEQEQSTPTEETEAFTNSEVSRTTRLTREHGFQSFDTGRAPNATYADTQFFELQAFMGMTGCGTAQGAARFQFHRSEEYGPHGDTHLRTVKKFTQKDLVEGFHQASGRLISLIRSESSFRRPATVAIDITTVPYYGCVDGMPMVSGAKDGEGRVLKFATLSIVGQNIPFILEVEPVRESSAWDDNSSNRIHRTVRRLVQRAREHISIRTVLCDREFDSMRVFQTLSNLDVDYIIPKRVNSPELEAIRMMEQDGERVAVEESVVRVEHGSHALRFLYIPARNGNGTAVFATNIKVAPKEAEGFCRRYGARWQIESEYKSIKHDFLAKTSSKYYRVRLFYFVFAALLHNIWRLTDFLLKVSVDSEMVYEPVLTAGETTELVASALVPPD